MAILPQNFLPGHRVLEDSQLIFVKINQQFKKVILADGLLEIVVGQQALVALAVLCFRQLQLMDQAHDLLRLALFIAAVDKHVDLELVAQVEAMDGDGSPPPLQAFTVLGHEAVGVPIGHEVLGKLIHRVIAVVVAQVIAPAQLC